MDMGKLTTWSALGTLTLNPKPSTLNLGIFSDISGHKRDDGGPLQDALIPEVSRE